MKVFLLSILIVAICVLSLSVRLLFGRSFVRTHVDQNPAMQRKGIHCVQAQDRAARREGKRRVQEKSQKQI